jgi:hypothetical protein
MADIESLRQVAQSRAPFSAWLGIMFLFALFGVIVLAVIGPSPRGDNYEQTRAKKRFEILKTEREEDTKALTTYAWIDKTKGSVRIPIERAMQLTAAELAQKKPAPANPIATPAAPESAAPASPGAAATAAPSPSEKSTPKATSVAGPQSENRGQPAAAANPPAAPPGTQPGGSATPVQTPAGTALPVPGKTP